MCLQRAAIDAYIKDQQELNYITILKKKFIFENEFSRQPDNNKNRSQNKSLNYNYVNVTKWKGKV